LSLLLADDDEEEEDDDDDEEVVVTEDDLFSGLGSTEAEDVPCLCVNVAEFVSGTVDSEGWLFIFWLFSVTECSDLRGEAEGEGLGDTPGVGPGEENEVWIWSLGTKVSKAKGISAFGFNFLAWVCSSVNGGNISLFFFLQRSQAHSILFLA